MPGIIAIANLLYEPDVELETVEVCRGVQFNLGWGEGFSDGTEPQVGGESTLLRIAIFAIAGEIADIDPAIVSVENGGSSRGMGESGRFMIGSILQDFCSLRLPPPPVLSEICVGPQDNLGPFLETEEIC